MKNKYLIVGKPPKEVDYDFRIHSIAELVWADDKDLAVRAFNHHFRDQDVVGAPVAEYNRGDEIENIFVPFTREKAEKYKAHVYDFHCGGQFGNLKDSWELSDLATNPDDFISIDKYLPEDLCLCLCTSSDSSYTKDCICKFDDGTMKFAHRTTIRVGEEEFWIEEWSRRQLKNAETLRQGWGGVGPAYHWVMSKEWADRVVAWRWFMEGEKKFNYM